MKKNEANSLKKRDYSNLECIGNRIHYLRKLTGLDRPSVERRHQIKEVSLEKWETGQANISPRSIARLLNMALDHSIDCTTEWLVKGEGHPPKTIPASTIDHTQVGSGNTTEDILRDLSYFKNTYPRGLTLMITDDSMMPTYVNGDFVGGNMIDIKDLKDCLDFACIVHTADGKTQVRRVGYSNGAWFLYGTNIRHKGNPFLEMDVEITRVAPIFWHRMKLQQL
jgi:transcriptional regulator with XRE-family HTH domain